MAEGALDVIVRFIGDSSQLRGEMSKVEGTGGRIKSWAKGIGVAIGGALAVSQVKDWIGAASELQDQVGAAGVVFGNASKTVTDFADNAAEAFGMSKSEALDAANTVAAFGKGAGLAGGDLAQFSTKLVGLAGDLASFRGTSPEQAIEAVGAALRGESEPIRAYGVLLNDATLKARAMSMGLVKSAADQTKVKAAQLASLSAFRAYGKAVKEHGKNSDEAKLAGEKFGLAQDRLKKATEGTVPQLTQQQKVLAAQAEIFAQTKDAQGDFARTSDSAANQQKKLKAELANTQAALGTALLPVLQKILPYFAKLAEFVQKNAGWLVPLAGYVLAVAAAFKVWSLVQALFNIQLGISMGWVLLIIAAIVALVAVVILIATHFDVVKRLAGEVWQAIQVAWDAILGKIQAVASAIWQWMQGAWDKILGAVQKVWDWIKTNWPTILAVLTGPIGVAVLMIVRHWDAIKAAAQTVINWFRAAWQTLTTIIAAPFRAAWSTISGIIESIKRAVSSAFSWVGDQVSAITRTIGNIVGAAGDVGGKIVGAIKGPLNAVIRAWNRLHIPGFDFKIDLPGPIPDISFHWGGIQLPDLPELARGGTVLRTGLALVHEGETFSGVGGGRASGGNTYNLNVSVAAGADPAQVGRSIVSYIAAFERANGSRWRASA